MRLTEIDIPEQVIDGARRASLVSFRQPEDVVLGSVVLTSLSSREMRSLVRESMAGVTEPVEEIVAGDYSLRVPVIESRHSLRDWLRTNLDRYSEVVSSLAMAATTDLLRSVDYGGKARELTETLLLEQIRRGIDERLRARLSRFAVQGLALRWVVRHFRDGYAVEQPYKKNREWHVGIVRKRDRTRVGVVRLDGAGFVLDSPADIRAQIEALRQAA